MNRTFEANGHVSCGDSANRRVVMRLAHRRATAVVAAAAIAVTVPGAGAPSAAGVAAAGSTSVIDWSAVSARTVAIGRPGGSSTYLQAITIVAIHDAVAAIDGGTRPLVSSPPVQLPADADAAVAAAAHDVLVVRVPGQASQVQAAYDAYLAGIPDGAAKANGIAVGQAVAVDVLADRADDGFDRDPDWIQPTPGPGVFEPVAPAKPVDIKMAAVMPFVLPVGDDGTVDDSFLPGPPIPLTSEEYAADFNEVKALGRKDGSSRTPEQTETAMFWAESPVLQWTRTFGDLTRAKGLDRVETARLFAMTFVSSADSLIVCLKAKYRYLFWRPVHAIQRADTDGNPATEADAAGQSLPAINHPEYPSGHACGTGAIVTALRAYFGTDRIQVTMSSTVTNTTRTFPGFRAIGRDVFVARIYSGLHFRFSMGAGFNMARHVARYVLANAFAN